MIDAEHLKGLWLPRRKTNNHLISLNEKSNIQFLELLGTKQTLNVIIPSLAHIYCAFFHRQLVYQKKNCVSDSEPKKQQLIGILYSNRPREFSQCCKSMNVNM